MLLNSVTDKIIVGETNTIRAGSTGKRFTLLWPMVISLFFLQSCMQPLIHEEPFRADDVRIIEPGLLSEGVLNRDAVRYYNNLAALAKWYYNHPVHRNISVMNPIGTNTLLDKLNSLNIADSAGLRTNIFDLDEALFTSFISNWIKTEAYSLTQKLRIDDSGNFISLYKTRKEPVKTEIRFLRYRTNFNRQIYLQSTME